MSQPLRRLIPQARTLITKESFRYQSFGSLDGYVEDTLRPIDIDPLAHVVQTAMKVFPPRDEESDGWLAPRVHASLRLFRSEAADQGIWDYLSVVVLRDYIIWRMSDEDGAVNDIDRIIGPFRHQALARLWWAAELSRNGADYRLTEQVFSSQDAVNYLTNVDAFHNRPAALAYIRFISRRSGTTPIKQRAIETGKTLNHVLTTIVLDSFAPDSGSDMNANERWIAEAPDVTLMDSALPQGPDEPQVPEEKIRAVEQLLERLMEEHRLLEELSKDKGIVEAMPAPGLTVLPDAVSVRGEETPVLGELSLAGPAGSGDAHAAIVETAESVYEELLPEQQTIARRIFLQLTELGEGTQDTPRRVTTEELVLRPENALPVDAMLKMLRDAHLITSDEAAVQIADEALIREWKRLREWLDEDREDLRVHRHLAQATQEWEMMLHDPNALYRGARLAQALEWAKTNADDISAREREFLDASKQVAEREGQSLAEAETRRAEEEHRAAMQWRQRAFYFGVAMITVPIIVAIVVYFVH